MSNQGNNMQTLIWNTLNSAQKQAALSRPAQAVGEQLRKP
ncbi:histidinol dehydrogenase [Pasteurella multocida subsp. multocida str. Anand1_cattle]|nr:histidinol dehydrogenase [Pasteurella multocida subsp. multocida str. Anand1_cattle]